MAAAATGVTLVATAGRLLVAEPLLGNLPNSGQQMGPWLPFGNMFRFLQVDWLFPAYYDMPWGETGSLIYFLLWVAVAFIAAAVVLTRRDA